VRADSAWKEPLRWQRETAAAEAAWYAPGGPPNGGLGATSGPFPYRPFVFPSMCDPFDNHPDLAEPRRRFFDLIRATPNLTWLLLTKRPGNIVKLFAELMLTALPLEAFWPRNAAIGCTIVTQEEADRDVPKLLAAKAALKPAFAFLSMEPLLGPVRLDRLAHGEESELDCLRGQIVYTPQHIAVPPKPAGKVDWVITGGETDQGPHKARPSDPAWFRALREQCAVAGAAFHHKQNGEWCEFGEGGMLSDGSLNFLGRPDDAPERRAYFGDRIIQKVGKDRAGRFLDGAIHDARPQVRP